jgi:uncharacterized protein YllA (UPF0747 family)
MESVRTLEAKFMRAYKKKNENALQRIKSLKEILFPRNSLQERFDNFIPHYAKHGDTFFSALKENLDPFNKKFLVISYDQ